MEGSRSPCNRAVAAPILRPQRAIVEVLPVSRRYSMTHWKKRKEGRGEKKEEEKRRKRRKEGRREKKEEEKRRKRKKEEI
jgi:hypothetical protein